MLGWDGWSGGCSRDEAFQHFHSHFVHAAPAVLFAVTLRSHRHRLQEFYGIIFVGHPNLKRILNVDEMNYFPMRKEYPLEDQTRVDKDDAMFGR